MVWWEDPKLTPFKCQIGFGKLNGAARQLAGNLLGTAIHGLNWNDNLTHTDVCDLCKFDLSGKFTIEKEVFVL